MKIILLAAISVSMLLTSCLTSLQPLVTVETVIEDNRLTGTWQQGDRVYKIERLATSAIYREMKEGIQNKSDDAQQKKPLTGREKEDSVLQSHAYGLSFTKEGVDYYMAGLLTRIGSQLYMEIQPLVIDDKQQPDGSGLDFSFDYLPGSTIARVELSNNTIQLDFPDGDFIKNQVNNGNVHIKHEKDDWFNTFLITASTRDLRLFFEKYGHDERLFSRKNSFTLTRKG